MLPFLYLFTENRLNNNKKKCLLNFDICDQIMCENASGKFTLYNFPKKILIYDDDEEFL